MFIQVSFSFDTYTNIINIHEKFILFNNTFISETCASDYIALYTNKQNIISSRKQLKIRIPMSSLL